MKSTLIAAAALTLAQAATTASAGVVISQEWVVKNQGRVVQKFDQTLMVQGQKQKLVSGDRETLIDLDAGKIYAITPKAKAFSEFTLPPTTPVAITAVWQGSSIDFKKTDATHKVAGYACLDYTSSMIVIQNNITATKCLSGDAPGAREFVEFEKALAQKIKGIAIAPNGEVPDGIPVSSIFTSALVPFTPPPGMPPEEVERIKQKLARHKPIITTVTVSKIELKDIPAETFVVPADFKVTNATIPGKPGTPPVTPGMAPTGQGSSKKPGAPAAPVVPAAP